MTSPLRIMRRARGLSQQKLADLVNTTQPTIDRLEKNKRGLTTDWISRFAKALDCEPAELLPNDDDAPGLAERDADYQAPTKGDELLRALYGGRPAAFWIRARSDALNLAGVLPGDYLICEPCKNYQRGDCVVVNIVDDGGTAKTMLREFANGFLKPRSNNNRHDPLPFDPDDSNLAIMGRIIFRLGGTSRDDIPAATQH